MSQCDLLAACMNLLSVWDEFIDDDDCMNPLDYPIANKIEDIRNAIDRAAEKPVYTGRHFPGPHPNRIPLD